MTVSADTATSKFRLVLKMLLIISGIVLTNHEVLHRLDYFISFGHYFPLLVFVGIWALALLAVFYVAFTPSQGARTLWTILIGLSALLGETYFRFSEAQISVASLDGMLELLALETLNQVENPDPANLDLRGFFSSELLGALFATGLLVTGLLMKTPPVNRLAPRVFGLFPMIPYGLLVGLVFYVGSTSGKQTEGMPSQFYNVALMTAYSLSEKPSLKKADPEITLTGQPGARHIVLIVDESVSGDFIDLNVIRNTTPYLNSVSSDVANFGLALAASNCSNASNAVLRLGANPSTLGLPGHSIINNPSIWKYASAAGFETTYINAQYSRTKKHNYMNLLELNLIDHLSEVPQETEKPYDDYKALEMLKNALDRDRPQFIFLNKRGAHGPYYTSYPDTEAIFTPTMQSGDLISDRNTLINTYKNAIRWSVDDFFEALINDIGTENYIIVYTSDHGQNLLDDGKPTTHCRRSEQNIFESIVPLLVWTDVGSLQKEFEQAALLNHDKASHFQIFPTLLVLMGYAPEAVTDKYYQSLFESIDTTPGYVTGPILGRFGALPTWNSGIEMEKVSR